MKIIIIIQFSINLATRPASTRRKQINPVVKVSLNTKKYAGLSYDKVYHMIAL